MLLFFLLSPMGKVAAKPSIEVKTQTADDARNVIKCKPSLVFCSLRSQNPLRLGGGRPLFVRLRLLPSPTRRTRLFCRFATFSPFHRGHLPVSSGEHTPEGKARVAFFARLADSSVRRASSKGESEDCCFYSSCLPLWGRCQRS